MRNVIILGASGFARQLRWCVERASGLRVVAMLDELIDEPGEYDGIPIIATLDGISEKFERPSLITAVGNTALRRRWAETFSTKHPFMTFVAPEALVAPDASVGEGSAILPGAICSTNTYIGAHTLIGFNACVSHDVQVGAFTHLSSAVVLNGNVRIGDGCSIGAGAVILPGISVGDEAVIGAGAIVHKDVEPGRTVAGVPARALMARLGQ